jgi:hypothetical protein
VPLENAPLDELQDAFVESKFSNEDVFYGLEDEPQPSVDASDLFTNMSVESEGMSDLSESVEFSGSVRRRQAAANIDPTSLLDQLQKVHEGGGDSSRSLDEKTFGSCPSAVEDQKMKQGVVAGGSEISHYSDGESMMETSVSFVSDKLKLQNSVHQKSPEPSAVGSDSADSSFLNYIYAYISSLVIDCAALSTKGLPSWEGAQTALLSSFVIEEGDMDNMLGVLEREIERTPPAIEAMESVRTEGIEMVRSFDNLRSETIESVRSLG